MFCTVCGKQLDSNSNFCSACGTAVAPPATFGRYNTSMLLRSREHRMLGGVCGGLALHYGWDLSLVRLLMVLIVIFTGVGAVAYLLAWIVIPQEPYMLPVSTSTRVTS